MSGWNYRVIKTSYQLGKMEPFYDYVVYTVYYDDEGNPTSWSEDPTTIAGLDKETLLFDLEKIRLCFYKPVLMIVDEKLVEIDETILDGTEYRD